MHKIKLNLALLLFLIVVFPINVSATDEVKITSFEVKQQSDSPFEYQVSTEVAENQQVQYRFWVHDKSENSWEIAQDYSEVNTFNWMAPRSGEFRIVVHVRDINSDTEFDVYGYKDIKVSTEETLNLESFNVEEGRYVGQTYRMTTSATGPNPVEYKYWVQVKETGQWLVAKDYSSQNYYDWWTKRPGEYRLVVHVRDVNSNKPYDLYTYKDVVVKPLGKPTINDFNVSEGQYVGKTYNITAEATSANSVLYKFWVYDKEKDLWLIAKDYSKENTYNWWTKKPGEYRIVAHVKDEASNRPYDVYRFKDVTVKPAPAPKVTDFSVSTSRFVNEPFIINLSATSTNQVLYKYWVHDKANNKWSVLKDFSNQNKYEWSTNRPGDYRLVVHLKDQYSSKEYDAVYYKDVTVENKVEEITYNIDFQEAVNMQLVPGRAKYDGAGNLDADERNVSYYMNPSNASNNLGWYLQFMRLDTTLNMPASELNARFLNNKGSLKDTGAYFIQAADKYGLNEMYLMSHALHETGNGYSTLARGIGVDSKGNIVRDNNGNIITDKNNPNVFEVVYNMFGYGAIDDDRSTPQNETLIGGARTAFYEGWFSPGAAVVGGAKKISNSYIAGGQNTLFKMKWDPETAGTGKYGKQYATHIMWAKIQAEMIYRIIGSNIYDMPIMFEIPKYLNQPGTTSLPPAPALREFPSNVAGEVTSNVNFRSGPSTSHSIYEVIPKGAAVQLTSELSNNWYGVTYNEQSGYIHGDYINFINLYRVNIESNSTMNYRTEPRDGLAGTVAGSVTANKLLASVLDSDNQEVRKNGTINGVEYSWLNVHYNGKDYWVAENFIVKE